MKSLYIFALALLLISTFASHKKDIGLGEKLKMKIKMRFNPQDLSPLIHAKNAILEKLEEMGIKDINSNEVQSYIENLLHQFEEALKEHSNNQIEEASSSEEQGEGSSLEEQYEGQQEDSSSEEQQELSSSRNQSEDSSSQQKNENSASEEEDSSSSRKESIEDQSSPQIIEEDESQNEKEEDESSSEKKEEDEKQRLMGGWEDYEIKENYLSDPYSALNIAHVELAKSLEEKGFKLRKIVKAESQLVNGVNMRLHFIYSTDDTMKLGKCIVYIPFNNDSAKLTHLEFQKGNVSYSTFNDITPINFSNSSKAALIGGYREADIDPKLLADPQSPLYKVNQQLEKELIDRGFKLSRIFRLQIQLVNGFNYKLDFQYDDGPRVKIGRAVVYISFDQKTISTTSFELFEDQHDINQ